MAGWANEVHIEGTVKARPENVVNRTGTEQAFFEICHEVTRGSRVHKNWFRCAVHGDLVKMIFKGGPELGRGLIPGDRVEIRGVLGARPKKCGGKNCGLYHNHWWINVTELFLVHRSLSETRPDREPRKPRRRPEA